MVCKLWFSVLSNVCVLYYIYFSLALYFAIITENFVYISNEINASTFVSTRKLIKQIAWSCYYLFSVMTLSFLMISL